MGQQPVQQKRHVGSKFLGIVFIVIFMITMIANQTLLNEKFVANQITESQIGDEIVSDVNQSASQYGLSEKIMTKKIANELIKDAISDVFNDQTVSIDYTPVYNRVDRLINQKVSSLGYGSVSLSSTVKSELRAKMTSVINDQLDTTELTTVSNELATVKQAVNVMQIVSGGVLALLLVVALFKRYVLSWLGIVALFGGILTLIIIKGANMVLTSVLTSQEVLASFSPQLPNAIFSSSLIYLIGAIIIGILLLGINKVIHRS